MDSGACKNPCGESSHQQQEEGVVNRMGGDENGVSSKKPHSAAETNGTLGPITPIVDRENEDSRIDRKKSPLTVIKKKPFESYGVDSICKENGSAVDDVAAIVADSVVDHASPKTPEADVFDPFAPGPEILVRAPMCKKYCNYVTGSVARRINFNEYSDEDDDVQQKISSGSDGYDSISDQEMFEYVYEDLLEVIVSTQGESLLAELPDVAYDSDDCKTPPSVVLFNGIAETCPGAPMKPTCKGRIIPVELRRRLEF